MQNIIPALRKWVSGASTSQGRPRSRRAGHRWQFEALEERRMLDGAGWLVGLGSAEGESLPAAISDFSLKDLNSTSATHNQSVSPRDYLQQVSGWYFAYATCGYCTAQFDHLNTLQAELANTYPSLHINILGVNQITHEAGNGTITQGKDIPWLQDVDADGNGQSDVWSDWQVAPRDIIILDGGNVRVGTYNLTTHDLSNTQHYATLRGMLIDAAMKSQKPWTNPETSLDVNNDGHISPIDALLIINQLNTAGSHALPAPTAANPISTFFDTNGDGHVSPADALWVINSLNGNGGAAGGEGESVMEFAAAAVEINSAAAVDRGAIDSGIVSPFDGQPTRSLAVGAWLAEVQSRGGWQSRLARPDVRAFLTAEGRGEIKDAVFADRAVDWLATGDIRMDLKNLASSGVLRGSRFADHQQGELADARDLPVRPLQLRQHRRG